MLQLISLASLFVHNINYVLFLNFPAKYLNLWFYQIFTLYDALNIVFLWITLYSQINSNQFKPNQIH